MFKHLAGRHNQQSHAGDDDLTNNEDAQNEIFPGALRAIADYIDTHPSNTFAVVTADADYDRLGEYGVITTVQFPGSVLEAEGTENSVNVLRLDCTNEIISDQPTFEDAFPTDTANKFTEHIKEFIGLSRSVDCFSTQATVSQPYQISSLINNGFIVEDVRHMGAILNELRIKRGFINALTQVLATKGFKNNIERLRLAVRLVDEYHVKVNQAIKLDTDVEADLTSKEHTLGFALLLYIADPKNNIQLDTPIVFKLPS